MRLGTLVATNKPQGCLRCLPIGYSGEGERSFQWQAERHSGAKVNSSRSEATLA